MSLTINHFYRFGEFTLDTDQRVLLRAGIRLPLTPKVFDTLLVLVENGGRIVGKEELMCRLWPDTFVEESNLTSNVKELRKALGDDARRPCYVETVARRGYRFIAEVEEVLSDSAPVGMQVASRFETAPPQAVQATDPTAGDARERGPGAATPARPAGSEAPVGAVPEAASGGAGVVRSGSRSRKGMLAVAAVVAAVLTAGGLLLLWQRLSAQTPASGGRLMLAVLPFENLTGDPSQEYFSDGLTEEMITQLGGLDPQRLGVIARSSVIHYKGGREPLDQVGRELGVQYVLEGSVRRDSDNVRVTVQLIKVLDQTPAWARQYDRQTQGILLLQSEIAQEVADQMRLTLGGGGGRSESARQPPLSPEQYKAYDLYLMGLYALNKRTWEGFERAVDHFQQAADADPDYARAYVGLADCYALMGGYSSRPQGEYIQKAKKAALHALELDGSSAEAHTALALIVQNYDHDWQTAGQEFRRAIELNPNYATAHHWYAEHLTWLGRFDEALSESARARQLDPLSPIIAADCGATLYYARQYDRAIEQFLVSREMAPDLPRARMIASAYEQSGLYADAIADLEKHKTNSDDIWYLSGLARIFGRSGQREKARGAVERLLEVDRREEFDAGALVLAYACVGDTDQAFAWLEKAYSQHSNILTTLKVEPDLDPLRADPRFRDLLRRVGLEQ